MGQNQNNLSKKKKEKKRNPTQLFFLIKTNFNKRHFKQTQTYNVLMIVIG